MPRLSKKALTGYAVLWAARGPDNYGETRVAPPVEIRVAWNNETQEVLDPLGNTVAAQSQAKVDREIPMNSILWHGRLAAVPENPTNLMQVISLSSQDTTRGRDTVRFVFMGNYNDELPTVVDS